MTDSTNDDPRQLSLGKVVTSLPAVRAARRVNTESRVHRRLIEPAEADQDIAFTRFFARSSFPTGTTSEDVRLWQRSQGNTFLEVQAGRSPDER